MSTFDQQYVKALAAADKGKKVKHDAEILAGIPSGVWASMWADEQEEKGRSFSGQNIMDHSPPVPAWAKKWAKKIADEIVSMNGLSLEALYEMVKAAKYPYDKEHFGYHLGMQSAGHGVSWSDDCDLHHNAIKTPYHEFYR